MLWKSRSPHIDEINFKCWMKSWNTLQAQSVFEPYVWFFLFIFNSYNFFPFPLFLSSDLLVVKMRAPSSTNVELGWPKWGGCGLGKEPHSCWGTSWLCWVSLLFVQFTLVISIVQQCFRQSVRFHAYLLKRVLYGSRTLHFFQVLATSWILRWSWNSRRFFIRIIFTEKDLTGVHEALFF